MIGWTCRRTCLTVGNHEKLKAQIRDDSRSRVSRRLVPARSNEVMSRFYLRKNSRIEAIGESWVLDL